MCGPAPPDEITISRRPQMMSPDPLRIFLPALCVALGIVIVPGAGSLLLDAPPPASVAAPGSQEYPQPGSEHAWLAERKGSWNAHCKMRMHPEGDWMDFPATEEVKVILGGFWVEATFKCDYEGMNFLGRSMMGYDQNKKKYISTWQDSSSSGLVVMEGTYDAAKKVMSLEGQAFMPEAGKMVDQRMVLHFGDDGSSVMKMFVPGPDGKHFQNMEIAYTKAGAKATSKPVR
jgi:hypothetical protein